MKHINYILLLIPFLLAGCFKDQCEETVSYIEYVPEFTSLASLKELNSEGPRNIEKKGKIYVYDHYLLINDYHKGIHIYDNENPANPVPLAFYPIQGNVDLSVKNNILYADNYLHLLSIDISDPLHPELIHINENVFITKYYQEYGFIDTVNQLITVKYIPTSRTETHDCSEGGYFGPMYWKNGNVFIEDNAFGANSGSGNSGQATTIGIGGSTARFTIIKDALYSVLPGELNIFDIANGRLPVYKDKVPLQWNAETIFPFNDRLLIGTSQGLLIYNLSDPLKPRHEGEFGHVSSCDPVVAAGDVAYVTLWSGSDCNTGGQANQLDILNISNMNNPVLITTVPLESPKGLGLDGNNLFICQGENGVKLYDVSTPALTGSNLKRTYQEIRANDIIILNNSLIIFTGDDSISQYSWDDNNGLSLLSTIE